MFASEAPTMRRKEAIAHATTSRRFVRQRRYRIRERLMIADLHHDARLASLATVSGTPCQSLTITGMPQACISIEDIGKESQPVDGMQPA